MRFLSDQNKVVGVTESGTYGNGSGVFWIGQVQSNTVTDAENKIPIQYLGNMNRSFAQVVAGPRDVTGTITYNPQDFRLVAWTMGSNVEVSGANYSHIVTPINNDVRQSPFCSGTLNPPISFGIEDSKVGVGVGRNFIRTVKGCVPTTATISCSKGERVNVDLNWVGQTSTFTSGNSTAVTANSDRPFLWSDCTTTIDGINVDTAKSFTLTFNENTEAPHYLNGSRDISVPFKKSKEITYSVTMDADTEISKDLYEKLYKAGSNCACTLTLNANDATGSQYALFALSGCECMRFTLPSPLEGINESSVEFRVKAVIGSFFDQVAYNPW